MAVDELVMIASTKGACRMMTRVGPERIGVVSDRKLGIAVFNVARNVEQEMTWF